MRQRKPPYAGMFIYLILSAPGVAQEPPDRDTSRVPRVVSVEPAIGAAEVDPSTREIVLTFDTAMSRNGYSLVGEGPAFPGVTDRPYWRDAYTFVIPVKLRAEWEYRFSVNGPGAGNFRSVWLVPAEVTECRFSTGGMDRVQRDADEQLRVNVASFDALADAIRQTYAHLDLRGLNWEQLFAEHRRDVVRQPTTSEWLRGAAKMLAAARDVNLWLELGDERVASFESPAVEPMRPELLRPYLPDARALNEALVVGETPDGIAYVLIRTWSNRAARQLAEVHGFLSDHRVAKGLIVDVRGNTGGSEELAKAVARWFVSEKRIYARHRFRRGPGPADFSPPRARTIEPNPPTRRFDGRVAVLADASVRGACEEFLLMMKQADRAAIIGQRTFGASGRPAPANLPNGVTAYIPSRQTMSPDGAGFEGQGIEPDISVAPRQESVTGRDQERSSGAVPNGLADGDPILERALEHLRERPKP